MNRVRMDETLFSNFRGDSIRKLTVGIVWRMIGRYRPKSVEIHLGDKRPKYAVGIRRVRGQWRNPLVPVGVGAAVLHVSRGKSGRRAVSLAKALCSIRASVATEDSDIESGRGWRHPPKHSLETTRGLDAKNTQECRGECPAQVDGTFVVPALWCTAGNRRNLWVWSGEGDRPRAAW